ncbi:MAG: hypothetical protein JO106_05360 [Mycobacterium sp.]|nr:hypothetical protein [Mycobacterium sp.]
MSGSRDDMPTDRLRRGSPIARVEAQQTSADARTGDGWQATERFASQHFSAGQNTSRPEAIAASPPRWNIGRDVVAGVLLLIAPLFPWNLYFGATVPHSRAAVFALLLVATVLSLGACAVPYAGISRFGHVLAARLRIGLNVPYALLVLGFVGFDVIQTVRFGGSANVPGGVGPGAWLGIAGALLSAQPLITGTGADIDNFRGWLLSPRILGYTSIVLAALSVLFNLFWRTKAALPSSTGSSGFGKQNVAIIATAVVYGVVALAVIIVASRWIIRGGRSSLLATIALGASTLVAGVIIWVLPVGREIDGFHGVAQNTSTAGVGFEGYLIWAAAAAIFAPLTLFRVVSIHRIDRSSWRAALRKGLLLITVWCLASVVMRITDVAAAAALNLGHSPYDSAAMAAFDLVTAVLAVWLRINLSNRALPVAVISSLCGVLLVLTVSRIVVGVALAPRIAGTPAEAGNPVYGNNLAQQITSTFDVVLAGLALCILLVAVITARFVQTRPHTADDRSHGPGQPAPPTAPPPSYAETTRLPVGGAADSPPAPRQQQTQSPRIHRPTEAPTRQMAVGPRPDATQRLDTGTPQIFRSDRQRNPAPPPERARQESLNSPPRIYREPDDPTH